MAWLDGVSLYERVASLGLTQARIVCRKIDYWAAGNGTNVVMASDSPWHVGCQSERGAEPRANCRREHEKD